MRKPRIGRAIQRKVSKDVKVVFTRIGKDEYEVEVQEFIDGVWVPEAIHSKLTWGQAQAYYKEVWVGEHFTFTEEPNGRGGKHLVKHPRLSDDDMPYYY